MHIDEVKIPKERIAVLIGVKGKIKREIEKKAHVRLKIDSESGIVEISGENSLDIFNAKPLIRAIARGLSPQSAKCLLNEDCILEIINIQKYSGDSKKKLITLRSRAIGSGGKCRGLIGKLTGTEICIYGKTIAIVGEIEGVGIAKRAFEYLLEGAPHGHVYKFIQDLKRKS